MPLSPGTRLGPYEVTAPLGAGGMGEVYRAQDTKLGRDVALKVLPEGFTADADRLARFDREAKVLASLNHPHIGHIYGLEESDGTTALVLEMVEGETLADRLARGRIPPEDVRPLFIQIAEGLEAAHERGIVHRDLKPANIKITPEGQVKILDFGLATAFAPGTDAQELSQSPTLARDTALGTIMGTAPYMSPEQARGKAVDKRTDVWAFGCCLYEALTGRRAFEGETVSDVVGSILRDEPRLDAVPPPMARLLRRCLRKDPRERLRDIGDVRIELEDPDSEGPLEAPGVARRGGVDPHAEGARPPALASC